jgi:intracellular septation protein
MNPGKASPGKANPAKASPGKAQLNPMLKLALDIGPLLLFFVANSRPALFLPLFGPLLPTRVGSGEHVGIFVATAVFMTAVVIALVISYLLTRHLPIMPVITAVIVLVFGSLTLILHDEQFIKLKPTIIYLLFGGVLLGGLAFGKPLLGTVFDSVFHLSEEGWRKLTLRWALFFFGLAGLNEIVWRTQTTDFWVSFKVFGVLPLTFLFAALQFPLMSKYAVPGPEQPER